MEMDIFLARQPIFHANQRVYGYEVLYRSGEVNKFDGIDGDRASKEVIINTFQTFGIDNLTNRRPAFINFTENLITEEVATLFPNELLVVEILEDVTPTEDVIKKCEILKEKGYRIALDDFVNKPEYRPLIELADIIKIDFMRTEKEEIENIIQNYKDLNIRFLAEKVETREDFRYARRLGFRYFQGYFFSKPEVVKTKRILPIKINYLQLVAEINKVEIDFKRISNIISRDLSLSYNLLRMVNSAAFGFRYRITGIGHAIVALGEKEIKKWVYLIMLNDMGRDRPDELTRLSLIRGRFAELIARQTRFRNKSDDIFLLGLFSLLDIILNKPMKVVLEDVKSPLPVREALLENKGEIADIYGIIINYEKGDWDQAMVYAEKLGLEASSIVLAYMDALRWYNKFVS